MYHRFIYDRSRRIYNKLTCPVGSTCVIVSIAYFSFLMVLPCLPSVSQIFYDDVNSFNVGLATEENRNSCGIKYFTNKLEKFNWVSRNIL